MNKKLNIIKITGFRGIALALFCVGCIIAGFLIFPGWICMHIWNYIAGFFLEAPVMLLGHGVLLWCIIALSLYALNSKNLLISFCTAAPVRPSEEKLREVLNKINEKNAQIIPMMKKMEESDEFSSNDELSETSDEDKIVK